MKTLNTPYPLTLTLVRHGQSEANLVQNGLHEGSTEFYDRLDAEMRLTAEGARQAQITGDWLKANGTQFDTFYSSPYVRTIETAYNLGISDDWVLDDLWRERDWGTYGMISKKDQEDDIYERSNLIKRGFGWYWKPEGGESLSTGVRLRVTEIMRQLSALPETSNVLAVSHGEFLSAFSFIMEGLTPHEWRERNLSGYKIPNAGVIEYTRVDPETQKVSPVFSHKRRTSLHKETYQYTGQWEPIEVPKYNAEKMLNLINSYPRLLG